MLQTEKPRMTQPRTGGGAALSAKRALGMVGPMKLEYADHWSLWLDLRMLLKPARRLLDWGR